MPFRNRVVTNGEALVSVSQAAALLGVHPNTVRAWTDAGRLTAYRINARGDRRFRRSDVERLLLDPAEPAGEAGAAGTIAADAGTVATSTDSAQLISRLRRELRRARALRGVISELSGQLDLGAVLEEVVGRTGRLFDAERGGLWLVREGRHPFELAAQYGLSEAFLARAAALTADSESLGNQAVRERRAVVRTHIVAGDGVGEMSDAYGDAGIRTACLVPLIADGVAVGLLGLYHETDREWPDDELRLVRAAANQAAIAITNARLYRSVASQAARMRSIQDLSARLNRLTDVRAIGQAIVDEASTLAEYHDIRVYTVDAAAGQCEPIAFTKAMLGHGGDYVERLRVAVGEGFTGWVAEHGEPLLIDDALHDPRGKTIDDTDDLEESMLLVPMLFESTVLGVIVLSQLGFGRFTADDLQTMTIFAGYAAQALANATAYERLARQSAELERQLDSQRRLLEINERLLSALDPSEVLDTIADGLHAVVRYDNLSIYRSDRDERVLRPVLTRERFAEEVSRYVIPFGRGLMGWVVEHGEPVLANDALADPRAVQIPGTPEEPEAIIIVPLIFDGAVIGALNVSRIGHGDIGFSSADYELVKLFAGQASIALRNADAHHAVSQRADTDALTGIGNHGAFQRSLAAAIEAAAGTGRSVGLLMMDLDRFKGYNDTLGHPAGDRLLHAVANAIHGAARADDRVFRYGGDEFALVLPGADAAAAERVGRRVRKAVERLTAGSDQTTSITVGVAIHPVDAADKNALISAADVALYVGKQAGGDRVVRADQLSAEVRSLRGHLDERARPALDRPAADEVPGAA